MDEVKDEPCNKEVDQSIGLESSEIKDSELKPAENSESVEFKDDSEKLGSNSDFDDEKDNIELIPKKKSPIVRMCNLSNSVSERQARRLFELIGELEEFAFYPSDKAMPTATNVAYARFKDPEDYKCATHLTGTLMLDRPLVVVPMSCERIPDEATAISIATQLASADVSQLMIGGAVIGGGMALTLNFGYPYVPIPLEHPEDYTTRKLSEVRRTIFVCNIHPEVILSLFSAIGEVRYVRYFEDKKTGKKMSFVEFSEASVINAALQFHEFPLYGLPIFGPSYSRGFSRRSISPSPPPPNRNSPTRKSSIHRSPTRSSRKHEKSPRKRRSSSSDSNRERRKRRSSKRHKRESDDSVDLKRLSKNYSTSDEEDVEDKRSKKRNSLKRKISKTKSSRRKSSSDERYKRRKRDRSTDRKKSKRSQNESPDSSSDSHLVKRRRYHSESD